MKKNILIFSHALEIGGAERALLGLLHSIDYSLYDVDLFLMRHEGELMDMIPDNVNLLPEIKEYTGLAVPMASLIKKRLFGVCFGRIEAKIRAKLFSMKSHQSGDSSVELEYSHKYTSKFMPSISDKKYDLAISFLTPHYFVAGKVEAKKKIAWIHTDYSMLHVDKDSEFEMWKRFDHIISISDDCTKGFLSLYPSLASKIVLMENISSPELIRKQSEQFNVRDEMMAGDGLVLLSIGRYSHQKNFDNVPDICRRVLEKGINLTWYLIGFGPEEDLIREKIREFHMEKHVIILGKRTNPYPYIKACDVYVQPSRYEGKAVTVREAQILHKPVIITDYPTAPSQVENGNDGIIVSLDNEECAAAMFDILSSHTRMSMLEKNCSHKNYDNCSEVNKLYQLIG